VTRGEIWLVNLDPTVGSEIRKTRPCVIVSPAEMHDHLRTVLVAIDHTSHHLGQIIVTRRLLGSWPPAK